jgi:hypothetical protein
MTKLVCLIFACFSLAAAGQISFHAFESYEALIEGGTAHTLVVDAGHEHLVTRVPRGYAATVDLQTQSVLFKENNGSIAMTMRLTTNSPGALPDDGTLRTNALAANPGGDILQVSGCATGYKPARFVDTVRSLAPFHSVRTRHAFVPCPEGIVEFMLSSKEEDFDQGRVVFNLFLSSFRVEIIKEPVKPPQ